MGKVQLFHRWAGASIVLLLLFFLQQGLSPGAIDPWGIFYPKKILMMYFAVALIQFVGALLVHFLGARAGAMSSGFLGGLVSSTAVTLSVGRSSIKPLAGVGIILAATLAMIIEAMMLVFAALPADRWWSVLDILIAPALVTMAILLFVSRRIENSRVHLPENPIDYAGVLKLTLFLAAILAANNLFKESLGAFGLHAMTFAVSLFEVHGSLMASLQMYEQGTISVDQLRVLYVIALAASYVSKLGLVWVLASRAMAHKITMAFGLILLSFVVAFYI